MSAVDDFALFDEWGPEKVVCVSDRRTGMRGALVIDNTARGIGKGGTRMSPTVTIGEVARLARVMTWKWAAVDLFYGGAKAGIRADPESPDKEAILRAFARALSNEVPNEYVFGLDVGLTENDAAVIQDELGDRGAAVGSPRALGGVPYDQWGITGFGVAEAADAALQDRGDSLRDATVVIQGFGAVGRAAARRCHELGARVIAVSDIHSCVYDPNGLDIPAILTDLGADAGDLRHVADSRLKVGGELELSCEVLIPAATQDVIGADLAKRLSATLVVEGANLPVTAAGLDVLKARQVCVVPDFIANAGGVIAAAFAMDARYSAFPPERSQILQAVSDKMRINTREVLAANALVDGETTHATARRFAAERVATAMRLRKGQR